VQSPNREVRDEARRQISRFVEVFVDCPIDQLISRDKTGQYKRALAGELKNLPGITEPYEPPTHPEVLVDTSKMTVDDAVEHLVGQLVALRYVDPGQAGLKSRPKLTAVSKIPLRPPPLEPAPKPVLYKAPPKSAAPAKEDKPAKAVKPAKPALKAVPNRPATAAKAAPAKKSAPAGKPAAKDVAKPKSAKLVVAKAPTLSAAKTGKASKPAAKSASKPKPTVKAVARPEAKRAAGGRKR
jgi:adenylylsulfate kinase